MILQIIGIAVLAIVAAVGAYWIATNVKFSKSKGKSENEQ
jgi:hypothetical protein